MLYTEFLIDSAWFFMLDSTDLLKDVKKRPGLTITIIRIYLSFMRGSRWQHRQ
ncbi:hypothetical protein CHELA1G11_10056 [Hyphomicrobiales bacterium]|nr:hypothetical protein CHELA1G11_10056 [Hyphomicrobiales bacterium]CAH1677378.1 hypothetical protein CHELA1G2_14253 [Hyphomicrobiales bacterium]